MQKLEPIRLRRWSLQWNIFETERYLLSGVLQSEAQCKYLAYTVPPEVFTHPGNRAVWLVLTGRPTAPPREIVTNCRAAYEQAMRRVRRLAAEPFGDYFEDLLTASPAPWLTPYHAAALLEYARQRKLRAAWRAGLLALNGGATSAEACVVMEEAID